MHFKIFYKRIFWVSKKIKTFCHIKFKLLLKIKKNFYFFYFFLINLKFKYK